MSEEDRFSELSDSLKKGLSDEFSTLKGLINDIADKMNLSDKEKNGVHKLENELSEYTCKTSGYDKYKDFIAKKNDNKL